jgi:hypothetical protein
MKKRIYRRFPLRPGSGKGHRLQSPEDTYEKLVEQEKGRTASGENSGLSRLSDVDVETIRIMRRNGNTQALISRVFNTHQSNISLICRGKSRRTTKCAA